MTAGIRLGRIYGAPIVADASAFILVVLFSVAVLIDLRTADVGDATWYWAVALATGVGVLVSILLHELSHAVVARLRGLHVRSIRLYVFGGYSVIDGKPTPATEVLVSLAGPVVSVAVGLGLWQVSGGSGGDTVLARALFALALANLAIGLFNLLPGFPLDGGRILRGLLASGGRDRVRATAIATTVGQWIGYAALGAGLWMLVRREPLGLFVLVAGWYLVTTSTRAGRREQLSAAFDGMTVRDAMRPTPEPVSGNSSVSTVIDLYMVGPRLRAMPVELDGRVVGVIGQEEVDSVAPARWPQMRVRALMTKIGPADVIEADEPLETLLVRPAGPARRVVVVDGGVAIGVIDGSDLAQVMPG